MWNPGFGWGIGHGLFSLFGNIIAGLAFILCVSVTIAVLFLLVRFLLVATRAAQLYVDRNGQKSPATAATSSHTADTGDAPAETVPTDTDSDHTESAKSASATPTSATPAPKSAAKAAAAKLPSTTTPKSPPAS